jgi:ABC-type glycerol-3-phosphate transport system substrate-binding protein
MSSNSSLFSNLSRKGALVDLYEFLEKDGELTKDDLVPTILSVCETEGKLTTLASSFYISTLGCKSKHFDKENWTIDEFIETCRNLPEGMKPFKTGNTNTEIFSRFVYNSNDFIDYNNATCNFNSPEFIKVLEFCNEYPNSGEGDEIDWENATDEEMNAFWEESEVALRNDKALLSDIYLSNPRDYARAVQGEFGEDVTLVGNPSVNGTGAMIYTSTSYAIMENSDYKDVCWDFIKEIFSEENQTSEMLYDFPVLKSAFDKKLDESMERPYYTDSDGKKQEYDDTWYIGGEEIKINPLTQAERDFVADYISNAKTTPYYYNQDIYDIISEESEAYFAGDKTAEQTAEIIQNRVSILISEQS